MHLIHVFLLFLVLIGFWFVDDGHRLFLDRPPYGVEVGVGVDRYRGTDDRSVHGPAPSEEFLIPMVERMQMHRLPFLDEVGLIIIPVVE